MSLAEAMAVVALSHGSRACHMAEVDHDDPGADRAALEELARYCRRFAPIVAIGSPAVHGHTEPECLQLDVTGTAGFFGGEGSLVRTAVWTLAARGIHARAAIADTPAAAWAAAHHTDTLHNQENHNQQKNHNQNHNQNTDTHHADSSRRQSLAKGSRHRRFAIVPAGGQLHSLAGLPATALRLEAAVVAQLRDVGIETIGGVARLPRKSLASRFGPQLARRLAEFTGERPEPLVVPSSGALPTASQTFDFPLLLRDTTLDDLITMIERLLQECVMPLVALGKGVMSLQVRLERSQSVFTHAVFTREACTPVIIDIGVFQPSSSVKHLLELVRLRMARMRMPREIEGIAVEVVSVGVAECRQRTLFGEAAETSASQVGMLLDRLSGRLGRGAVFEPRSMADAQPEHAWMAAPPTASRSRPALNARVKKAAHEPSPQNGPRAGRTMASPVSMASPQRRPIWLLPRPLQLDAVSVVDSSDAAGGPPVRFHIGQHRHEVVKSHGPERIETAWWRGPTVRRDYYVVETRSGGRYWIFRRLRGAAGGGPGGGWFLHGTFS
jgi:protein ImuB